MALRISPLGAPSGHSAISHLSEARSGVPLQKDRRLTWRLFARSNTSAGSRRRAQPSRQPPDLTRLYLNLGGFGIFTAPPALGTLGILAGFGAAALGVALLARPFQLPRPLFTVRTSMPNPTPGRNCRRQHPRREGESLRRIPRPRREGS